MLRHEVVIQVQNNSLRILGQYSLGTQKTGEGMPYEFVERIANCMALTRFASGRVGDENMFVIFIPEPRTQDHGDAYAFELPPRKQIFECRGTTLNQQELR